MQAFVDRFRYKVSKARQAQSRLKAIERMTPIVVDVGDEWSLKFDFPSPEPLAPPLVTLDHVDVGYEPGKPILRDLDLRIDMDDRIAMLGANGNGKSTLVKLLANRLKPMAGELRRSGKLKVGYFAQHQQDELDLDATPLQILERMMPLSNDQKRRGHLGRFGFSQNKALTRCGALSGGEKARLLFALMCREAPHIILLDEPTNHLDIDAREALVQALNAYEGAVVLISHDPHLIELTADRLWLVHGGTCKPFDGDMDDYRKLLLEQRRDRNAGKRAEKGEAAGNGAGKRSAADRKEQRRLAAEARAAAQHLRHAAKDAEKRLEKLQGEHAVLEARLGDPKVYDGPTKDLMALQVKLGDVKKRIAAAEEAWLEAQAVIEQDASEEV
jgi:ATP-binding cassette subfamily F protein 3